MQKIFIEALLTKCNFDHIFQEAQIKLQKMKNFYTFILISRNLVSLYVCKRLLMDAKIFSKFFWPYLFWICIKLTFYFIFNFFVICRDHIYSLKYSIMKLKPKNKKLLSLRDHSVFGFCQGHFLKIFCRQLCFEAESLRQVYK